MKKIFLFGKRVKCGKRVSTASARGMKPAEPGRVADHVITNHAPRELLAESMIVQQYMRMIIYLKARS